MDRDVEITHMESYGVFVTWGDGQKGLVHISQLAPERIQDPAQLFSLGDRIDVQVRGPWRISIVMSVCISCSSHGTDNDRAGGDRFGPVPCLV